MLKKFKDLTEKEILAIAIAAEEEDGRIYGEFADALRDEYPSTAEMFEEMREEEVVHRDRLFAMFRQRFGEHIPLIRRENVKGFLERRPVWLVRPLGVKVARKQAELMEMEASRFYARAASRTTDASTRELLNKLADEERKHTRTAGELEEKHLTATAKAREDESHRKLILLQVVQPGLAGLMDGSVSTLAPLFAAAFATHKISTARPTSGSPISASRASSGRRLSSNASARCPILPARKACGSCAIPKRGAAASWVCSVLNSTGRTRTLSWAASPSPTSPRASKATRVRGMSRLAPTRWT